MEDKLRIIQLCELDILKEIARICDKNGINYYLAAGTMLGAVRHQGFIPWDDDADVYMSMEDFKKFEKCCKKELGREFFLQTPKSEPYSRWLFFKVRKEGTMMMTENESDLIRLKHQGIWVDIFPLINCPDDKQKREKQVKLLKHLQTIRYKLHPRCAKSVIGRIFEEVFEFKYLLEEQVLWRKIYRLGNEQDENILVISNIFFDGTSKGIERDTIPKKYIFPVRKYNFEGNSFSGVADSNAYLVQMYGKDYMTPKRFGEHINSYENVIV